MKFLVDGFGSIGQRHVNNLIRSGYNKIIVITKKKITDKRFGKLKFFKKL